MRRAPPNGPGTGPRRAPFCASSLVALRDRGSAPLKTPCGARTLACCIDTRADAASTLVSMSARRRDESRRSTQECVRHGVFMNFGGPAGPWTLPSRRGSECAVRLVTQMQPALDIRRELVKNIYARVHQNRV